MKKTNFSQFQSAPDFLPSADDAARMAYLAYVNEGSQGGCDVQHWLEAEAQLLAQCNLTRLHALRNRN
jgi:hypothetical protein